MHFTLQQAETLQGFPRTTIKYSNLKQCKKIHTNILQSYTNLYGICQGIEVYLYFFANAKLIIYTYKQIPNNMRYYLFHVSGIKVSW